MVMRRFVEAVGRKGGEHREPDRIPGTNKVRTYVTGSWLYSKESDIKRIIAREQKAFSKKQK